MNKEERPEKSKLIKHVIFYNMIGIIVCAISFIANNYLNIVLFEINTDLRFFGVIFLASMIGYTLPLLSKLLRTSK